MTNKSGQKPWRTVCEAQTQHRGHALERNVTGMTGNTVRVYPIPVTTRVCTCAEKVQLQLQLTPATGQRTIPTVSNAGSVTRNCRNIFRLDGPKLFEEMEIEILDIILSDYFVQVINDTIEYI